MSKMIRLELVGLVLLACTQILTEHRNFHDFYNQYGHQRSSFYDHEERLSREVRVAQGRLRGRVVYPSRQHHLPPVDMFLGVPYAAPPMGTLRFTPPQSPRPWSGVRRAYNFAPVCPQVLPDLHTEVTPGRYKYLQKLFSYLTNKSEDCLYLNIYAPHQTEGQRNLRRFPVMVYIHGESFEWGSGNPYNGSVISSYGNVVFVTINFRLGILGFLRPGTSDNTPSNFGLLDQVAVLLWVKENIAAFGGDPNSVTLVGHGTGAIFANLLLISPVATRGVGLFKRGVFMSGSALSPNAIGKAPLQVTKQVAHALNCPTTSDKELANCLQIRPVDTLLDVRIDKPLHVPAYAPLIDGMVLPKSPLELMKSAELFSRYELMYGVTESEKFHELPPVGLLHGLLDHERDKVLREHVKASHELEPEMVLSKILEHYGDFSTTFPNDFAFKNREIVLQALSDSETVAPLILTGTMHSKVNPKSYMYVFSHPRAMQEYYGSQQQRTVPGEELAYLLGIPVGGGRHDLQETYNIGEALFSEAMMTWWCNFAHTGNPNAPGRSTYLTDGPKEWLQYERDWPEFSPENQTYFNLTIPPEVGSRYRVEEMKFWNEYLPDLMNRPNLEPVTMPSHKPARTRPSILDIADGITTYPGQPRQKPMSEVKTYLPDLMKGTSGTKSNDDTFSLPPPFLRPLDSDAKQRGDDVATTPESSTIKNSSAISLVVGFGIVFLLINVIAIVYLYHKRNNAKTKEKSLKRRLSQKEESSKRSKIGKQTEKNVELGHKHDSKPDLNDVLKNDKAYDNNSNFGRRSKLSRQSSNSTIDTHIKVREWIQQEIVHRCSPRFLRKTRENLQKEHQDKLNKQQEEERKKVELEKLINRKDEPIYDESPVITVRPGKKLKNSKLPKVSVGIDATPSARTESVLNQIPVELAQKENLYGTREEEDQSETIESSTIVTAPQVVIIEHHHSKSDPFPMDSTFRSPKSSFSSPKVYESDSGSTSSLYAKVNPKTKSRLPRVGAPQDPEQMVPAMKTDEDIYSHAVPKLTTFGTKPKCEDVNVTCREPTVERDAISPEEALKTIKRRKYPKVLPDIEKRRSLPVPNTLFVSKQSGNSLKGLASAGSQPNSPLGHNQLPVPPPRAIFGTSKSLDLAEEDDQPIENEPIITNLHVGPLLKRQDSTTKNHSDPNLIETLNRGSDQCAKASSYSQSQSSGNINATVRYPESCGTKKLFSSHGTDLSSTSNEPTGSGFVDLRLGNPNWYKPRGPPPPRSTQRSPTANVFVPDTSIGNPNWYKPIAPPSEEHENNSSPVVVRIPILRDQRGPTDKSLPVTGDAVSGTFQPMTNQLQHWEPKGFGAEPKIVITPRVGNLLGQSGQNLSSTVSSLAGGTCHKFQDDGPRVLVGQRANLPLLTSGQDPATTSNRVEPRPVLLSKDDKKEPTINITPGNCKQSATNLKQPKIIIKPSTNPQKTRDNKNIPKVSAIPSPECQNLRNTERDRTGFDRDQSGLDKPPLKEKPKVTRIPSFSKKKEDQLAKSEKAKSPVYAEKTEIVQRIEAVPTHKITNVPLTVVMEQKSGKPSFLKKLNDTSLSSTDSSSSSGNLNTSDTGTIRRKPK